MFNQTLHKTGFRPWALILSFTMALLAVFVAVQMLAAEGNETADLSGSTKSVDQTEAQPGDTLKYTIIVSNSGATAETVLVTDTLQPNLAYVTGTFSINPNIGGDFTATNDAIIWHSTINQNFQVTLTFDAVLTDTLSPGDIVTNTVDIDDGSIVTRPFAETIITSQPTTTTIFMPIIFRALDPVVAALSVPPNANNQWTIGWTAGNPGVTGYIIQESRDSSFATVSDEVTVSAPLLSLQFTRSSSANPVYYYRVKALAGFMQSDWSNVVRVVGGYYDNFSDPSTGWTPVRRTTYLEKTIVFYGTGNETGYLVLIVDDRWDWMIASPLQPAPAVPYAIEYRAKIHMDQDQNLTSGGMAFGGDWNGQPCPEYGNIYASINCFNHFYNFNYIWYGPMKLQHEQVNEVVYCPTCGGSPLKRLGVIQPAFDVFNDGDEARDWHTYRVEVRSNGSQLFIDGALRATYPDTTWINDPYFGVFASTDEYKPSIWLFDYFQITPLN